MANVTRDTPCPGCGYNLRGLEEQHRCPECGFDYDLGPRVMTDMPSAARMTFFDRACAILGLALGVTFLIAGALGLFFGVRLWIDLPPVLGVLPALAGWGIYRTFRIAWRAAREPRPVAAHPVWIPPIYRDPVPDAEVDRLDREIGEHIENAPASDPPRDAGAPPTL